MEEINIESSLNLLMKTLVGWWEAVIKGLPSFVLAIVVLILAWVSARLARKLISTYFPRVVDNQAVVNLTATIGYIVVFCIGVFFALGILHLEKTVTSLLAGAGVIGLALGFAFQEIASNFVAGIIIAFRKPYAIGDIVDIEGNLGKVHAINLRVTTVRKFDGLDVLVPNKIMLTQILTNLTTTSERKITMELGVSYSDKLRDVGPTIVKALEDLPSRLKDKPIEVYFKEFGGSSINLEVFAWIDYPGDGNFFKARSEMVMRIKEALDENGFNIPFPIRTLDINNDHNKKMVEPLLESLPSQL